MKFEVTCKKVTKLKTHKFSGEVCKISGGVCGNQLIELRAKSEKGGRSSEKYALGCFKNFSACVLNLSM